MARTPQHAYEVLTKRPERYEKVLDGPCGCGGGHLPGIHFRSLVQDHTRRLAPGHQVDLMRQWPLANVWLGTSIERDDYVRRADALRTAPATTRFLSLEPLLGPLPSLDLEGIDWVIVGGESGPDARPMHPDWARDLRDRCVALAIPFFFKALGRAHAQERRPHPRWPHVGSAARGSSAPAGPHVLDNRRRSPGIADGWEAEGCRFGSGCWGRATGRARRMRRGSWRMRGLSWWGCGGAIRRRRRRWGGASASAGTRTWTRCWRRSTRSRSRCRRTCRPTWRCGRRAPGGTCCSTNRWRSRSNRPGAWWRRPRRAAWPRLSSSPGGSNRGWWPGWRRWAPPAGGWARRAPGSARSSAPAAPTPSLPGGRAGERSGTSGRTCCRWPSRRSARSSG